MITIVLAQELLVVSVSARQEMPLECPLYIGLTTWQQFFLCVQCSNTLKRFTSHAIHRLSEVQVHNFLFWYGRNNF